MMKKSKNERILCRKSESISKTYSYRRLLMGTVMSFGMLGLVLQPETSNAAAKKPEFSQKKIKMVVGKKAKLSVKNKKGYTISWKSSKKEIATVSKTGKIQAKKQGNARITALIEPSKGGKSYRLSCRVSVRKWNGKGVASGNTKKFSAPTVAGLSAEGGQMQNKPVILSSPSDPKETEQPGTTQCPLEDPADSTTGGAVIPGEAKLLFGDYNDNIPGEDFLGNQKIDSYEELQILKNQIWDLMEQVEEKRKDEKVSEYYRFGYETLQRYFDQLGAIEPDYFADHVLYIYTMNVARGYDYALASVKHETAEETLHLYVERFYHLKEGQCVTCDMPFYSYFFQIPRSLSQGCNKMVISLIDQENRIPSEDPDLPVFTDEVRICG